MTTTAPMTAEELDALGQLARDSGPGSQAAAAFATASAAAVSQADTVQAARTTAEDAVYARWSSWLTTVAEPAAQSLRTAFATAQADTTVGHDTLAGKWVALVEANELVRQVAGSVYGQPSAEPQLSWSSVWDETVRLRTVSTPMTTASQVLTEVGQASDAAAATASAAK